MSCCGTSSRSSASGFHVAGAGSTAGASALVTVLREKQADSEPQSGSAAATGSPALLPPGPTLKLSFHHSSCSCVLDPVLSRDSNLVRVNPSFAYIVNLPRWSFRCTPRSSVRLFWRVPSRRRPVPGSSPGASRVLVVLVPSPPPRFPDLGDVGRGAVRPGQALCPEPLFGPDVRGSELARRRLVPPSSLYSSTHAPGVGWGTRTAEQ